MTLLRLSKRQTARTVRFADGFFTSLTMMWTFVGQPIFLGSNHLPSLSIFCHLILTYKVQYFWLCFRRRDDLSRTKPNSCMRTAIARCPTHLFHWRAEVPHWTSLLSWQGLCFQVCWSRPSWWFVVLLYVSFLVTCYMNHWSLALISLGLMIVWLIDFQVEDQADAQYQIPSQDVHR